MRLESLVGHTFEVFLQVYQQLKKPQGIPPDSILDSYFRSRKYLGSNDRKFIAGNVYAALRYYHKALHKVQHGLRNFTGELFEEDVLFLLLLSTMTSESVAESQIEALCSRFLKGNQLQQFIPKFLESQKRYEYPTLSDVCDDIALQTSFPRWMVERFLKQYGEEETRKLCMSLNEPAPITVRVNTLKTTVEECQARLLSEGVESERARFAPHGLYLKKRMSAFSLQTFRDGWFEVQDEGSQLLAYIVNPKPTEKILDACAGAGGKTLAFAALMSNRGEIVATDVNAVRLQELRKRAKRAGVHNVRVFEIDTLEDLQSEYRDYFSIVFVDAPCTGLGTIRRNPGLKLSVTEDTVAEVQEKQRAILDAVAPLVKINGILVYATCSILREENEEQVEQFLARHSNYEPWSLFHRIFSALPIPPLTHWFSLLPHNHGTDGFFFTSLRRVR